MMSRKLGLKEKVDLAWFKATGQTNGYEVFLDMVYKDGQEDIARKFQVSLRTSARWHDEFKTQQPQAAR